MRRFAGVLACAAVALMPAAISAQTTLVSFPANLALTDPLCTSAAVTGTLSPGDGMTDVSFTMQAINFGGLNNLALQPFKHILECPATSAAVSSFVPDWAYLADDNVDQAPPACVTFGLATTTGQERSGIQVTFDTAVKPLVFIAPIYAAGGLGQTRDDIVFSGDFEILDDGCMYSDDPSCQPLVRRDVGRLGRTDTSRGTIRFLDATQTITIQRNTLCLDKFDFTIAINRAVDCIVGTPCDWSDCDAQCGTGQQTRTRANMGPWFGGKACTVPEVETQTCQAAPCPVDCAVSDFTEWSQCSATCGGGMQTRTRTITTQPVGTGKQCPPLTETQPCNTDKCPVDCVLSPFGDWSQCSATCGGGIQTRTRTIITPGCNGGQECPVDLSETRACNTDVCPVDCQQSEWGPWSQCSVTCGDGTQTRTRTTITFPVGTGKKCDDCEQTQPCNAGQCPQDCLVGDWSAWSQCSKQCGGGKMSRTRSVIQACNGGAQCPPLYEEADCNTQDCPVDCVMSQWSEWGQCSATCGGGIQTSTRTIITPSMCGGQKCPTDLTRTQACNTQPCPVDCQVSDFCEWSSCSKTCGGGIRTRSRTVITQASYGGDQCPTLVEQEACNTQKCPQDCVLGPWSDWSTCSASCNGGMQKRTRQILTPCNGGVPCDVTEETRPCNTQQCNVDCQVSDWCAWSQCDKPCGTGKQTRTRTITVQPQGNGKSCPALTDYQSCNTQSCATDCVLSDYGAWSTCSKTCGGGSQTRTRTVITPAKNGGTCPCTSETQACNTQDCPVDCVVSDWSSWTSCSATCNGGTQSRTRTILVQPKNGGAQCPSLQEQRGCNTQGCPVDCSGIFSPWSQCSASCGGGVQTRTLTITQPALNGGKPCCASTETRPCNTQKCVQNCVLSDWSPFSQCSATCGGGKQTRTRTIVSPPSCGGAACGPLTETVDCNTQSCPVDCVVSDWSVCSECSKKCGGGVTTRTRTILVQPSNGGKQCPALTETTPCNTQTCPPPKVDCVQSDWSEWSECSKECGCGISKRTRTTLVQPANGGIQCGPCEETRPCHEHSCERDCQVSDWSDWSKCTKSCGGGVQLRYRKITQFPSLFGGKMCPPLIDVQPCNTQECPVDCQMGAWSNWSQCSKTCGGGKQTRVRFSTVSACHGGAACPPATEERDCNTQQCPTDCQQGPWSEWSQCSATCGGGVQTRTRKTMTKSCSGGASCGPEKESRPCNTRACPRDCQVSSYGPWSQCSATCGGGVQTRTRKITVQPLNGGKACPCLTDTQSCNTKPCSSPVDCKMGDWSPFSTCSKTCGGGTSTRTRKILSAPCSGGKSCPATSETVPCNTQACPPPKTDCKVTDWSSWSQCSKSCGGGVMTRTRKPTCNASNGGASCPPLTETMPCNTQSCPVPPTDCKVSDFGPWSTCSKSCGGGIQTRTRTIITQPCKYGASCPALTETQACNTQQCTTDCSMGSGTTYTVAGDKVTVTYANGIDSIDVNVRITYGNNQQVTLNFHPNTGASKGQTVVFNLLTHPNFPYGLCSSYCVTWVQVGGTNCHWGDSCMQKPICLPVPEKCDWKYNAFGSCSNQCGAGKQTRTATCQTASGKLCDPSQCTGSPLLEKCCSGTSCGASCLASECGGAQWIASVSFDQGASGTLTGTIKFTNAIADIRGFFIDFAKNSRLNGKQSQCTITGSVVTAMERNVVQLGCSNDVNLNGCKGGPSAYDLGVAFGSAGIGKDDVNVATITLKCNGFSLTPADVVGSSVGVRATSVGPISGGQRAFSTKNQCVLGQ